LTGNTYLTFVLGAFDDADGDGFADLLGDGEAEVAVGAADEGTSTDGSAPADATGPSTNWGVAAADVPPVLPPQAVSETAATDRQARVRSTRTAPSWQKSAGRADPLSLGWPFGRRCR
jgi:hypothetical protein